MDSQTTPSTPIDVYQLITDQIIDRFEHGIIPWHKPWNGAGIPRNLLSTRQYRGINVWLLLSLGYKRNVFVTWEQLKSINGSVNKDEKGHLVAYWKPFQTTEVADAHGSKQKSSPKLGYYRVFNISQCRDIPSDLIPDDAVLEESDSLIESQRILSAIPDMPGISYRGKGLPSYSIKMDEIVLPKMKSLEGTELYYRSVFHELIHATGAEKRLHRKTVTDLPAVGTESYITENLIADMGCALLCGASGIQMDEMVNKSVYVNTWLDMFMKNNRILTTAAGHAQRAVDFILNQQQGASKEEANAAEESVVS